MKENKIYKKRLLHLDFARAIAVLFMFTQHCMIIHDIYAGETTLLGQIFIVSGTAPAAPIFLLIMGIFIKQSNAPLKKNIVRGLKIFLLGYILNIFRFVIPLLIAKLSGETLQSDESILSMFLSVDIFQLAGLAFIITSVLKRVSDNKFILPAIILIILLISPLLWGVMENYFFLQPLWGSSGNVYFPLFPWLIYPLLGLYQSNFFYKINEKKRIVRSIIVGISAIIISVLTLDYFTIGDYYRSGLAVHIGIIGFIFLWIPLCYGIVQLFNEGSKLSKAYTFFSKNVTSIYFIQWILFGWSILIFGYNSMPDWQAAIVGFIVLLTTILLVKLKRVRALFSWI